MSAALKFRWKTFMVKGNTRKARNSRPKDYYFFTETLLVAAAFIEIKILMLHTECQQKLTA